MEITKEQIKRLAKAAKAMQEKTLIDDDVSAGYQPDPFKDAYAEIYNVIDECERGLNVDSGENTLHIQRVNTPVKITKCKSFKIYNPYKVDTEVNEWLSSNRIVIKNVQQTNVKYISKGKYSDSTYYVTLITIFYEDA